MTPLNKILNALREHGSESRLSGNDWMCRCPAHEDSTPSLSIREKKPGGRIFVKCFAGCKDTDILKRLGLSVKDLFPEGERVTPPLINVRSGLKVEDLAAAKNLPVGFLKSLGVDTTWVKKTTDNPKQSVVKALVDEKTWASLKAKSQWREVLIPYREADGTDARPRRRMLITSDPQSPDMPKCCWAGTKDSGEIVPYGLDRLSDAREKKYLILVEGESDCWTLWFHGYPALGIPGSCNIGKLMREHLDGIDRVYLIQEPDAGGETLYDSARIRLSSWKSWKGELLCIHRPGGEKDVSDLHIRNADGFNAVMDELLASAESIPLDREQTTDKGKPSAKCPYALGAVDEESGRLVLSTQRTLPTAEAYVAQFHSHPEGSTFIDYAGMQLEWKTSHFKEVEQKTMRHRLLPWLHNCVQPYYSPRSDSWTLVDFPANPRTVHSALESLQAYTHLPAEITTPCWLGDSSDRPPADEILPCKSVMLHLPTMKTCKPTPAYFCMNGVNFDPDSAAKEPVEWLQFLRTIFHGDAESITLLQDWFGYCLTGDTSQQKMLLLVGPKRCGKGTIARVLTKLIGRGNVAGPTTSSLATDFGLQPLLGKSLAIVSDARFTGNNIQTVIERLLCISGEDLLTIDRKHISSVTLKLSTRFMFLSNEIPRLSDASGALAGRFMILKFTESFFGREDKELSRKLYKELPGILNWAIAGWKRLRERGRFKQPKFAEDMVDEMEGLGSPVGAFLRDCCVIGPTRQIDVDVLYSAWRIWCCDQGNISISVKSRFGRDLIAAESRIRKRRNNITGHFYEGVCLNEEWVNKLRSFKEKRTRSDSEGSFSFASEEVEPKSPFENHQESDSFFAQNTGPTADCDEKCIASARQVHSKIEDKNTHNNLPQKDLEDQCMAVHSNSLLQLNARTGAHVHARIHAHGEEVICNGNLLCTAMHQNIKAITDNKLPDKSYYAPDVPCYAPGDTSHKLPANTPIVPISSEGALLEETPSSGTASECVKDKTPEAPYFERWIVE